MPSTITMPKLSPTMEEGTIAKWHFKEGDEVHAGDVLIEVATDKATVEYNALDPGFLRKILVQEGGIAQVGDPIAILTETKDESIEGYDAKGTSASETTPEDGQAKEQEMPQATKEKKATKKEPSKGLAQPSFKPLPPKEKKSDPYLNIAANDPVLASPIAKKIAKEKNIDLSQIKGSGPHGRIVEEDVKDLPSGGASFYHTTAPSLPAGSYTEVPLSPMRKVIGQRLQASKTFIPHFYVSTEVNVSNLFDLKDQMKAGGLKLTINDFIIKAVALALKKHPQVNSGYNSDNDTIIQFDTIDISIAVTIPDGLITPIISHADYKRIDALSKEAKDLFKKAREGKLAPDEYQGGSFTISNLGMYNVSEFIAVINPPQAAILAVAGAQNRVVMKNGSPVEQKMMKLTLASDHRVIDGKDAAEFMQTLNELLANPAVLII